MLIIISWQKKITLNNPLTMVMIVNLLLHPLNKVVLMINNNNLINNKLNKLKDLLILINKKDLEVVEEENKNKVSLKRKVTFI